MGGLRRRPGGGGGLVAQASPSPARQNAIPGVTNRWLARFRTGVLISFPASLGRFPQDRWRLHLQPHPGGIFQARPPWADYPFTVLITGGSQGVHHLNLQVLAGLPELADLKDRLRFFHLTGEADREAVAAGYAQAGFAARVEAFSPAMPELMASAHLIVCRAGASTLAEFAAVGRAALLVPYPFAANNHQEFNAHSLAQAGAAEIILNKDFTGALFAGKIQTVHVAARYPVPDGSGRPPPGQARGGQGDCAGLPGVDPSRLIFGSFM